MSQPRAAIVTFSQTGNTEKVAGAIAEGLRQSGAEVELLDMLKTDPDSLAGYDLIGVGAPTFYYREPINVERFMRRIPRAAGKHAFIFLTSGGHPCNTFYHMRRTLSRRGYLTIDAFACHGYDTYPPFKGANRFLGRPDLDDLEQARTFGAQLIERSSNVSRGQDELLPTFKRHWDRFGRLSIIFRNRLLARIILPKKNLDTDKCTKCGLCAQHCPVDVIDMTRPDGFPVFKSGCIYCTMCERVCPEEAIVCDWTFIKKKVQASDEGAGPE